MNTQILLSLLGSAGYLAGGVWALIQRAHRPVLARLMAFYCLLALVWTVHPVVQTFGLLNGLRADFVDRLPIYGVYTLAVALLLLTRRLVGLPAFDWRWLIPAVVWGAAVLAIDAGVLPFPERLYFVGGRTLSRAEAVLAALVAGWAVSLGAATGLTVWTLHKTSRYYTSLTYWTIILMIIVAGDGLVFAGQPISGNLLRLAAALLAVSVVTTQRLPAIEHTLRQVLGRVVFLGASIGVYAAALMALQLVFGSWGGRNPLAISLGVATVLVLLFNSLLQRINRWARRSVSGGARRDAAGVLRQYSQNITGTMDLSRLATLAVGTAGEFLEVKRGYLFLVDQEKGADDKVQFALHGVRGMGPGNPENGNLSVNSPLAAFFQESGRPITQAEIDQQAAFTNLAEAERAWLDDLGAEVYVPICAKSEWIGLLALGPKGSGVDYSVRDLALLSTLADQTAVALENTRLVEGLMRLNNEFRRAYTALDQANQHLERLDKTKSDFISIASHELRTPLTLINGASQMLLEDPDLPSNPYHQQLLQKIKAGGDRLHEIVETMLDMAKIDQRTLELEPQPVSFSGLLQSVYGDLKKSVTERNLTVDMDVPADLPAVIADVIALRKVFFHLLTNAIKYTPDGGRITVVGKHLEANTTDLPNGGVEIVVSDTGIGIDPRLHELIFVKFYQTGELALHSTGKTKFKGGGPGLGLAISRGIIAAHHGRIWVESPGYDEQSCPGSQFHVVLPLRPTDRPVLPPSVAFK